MRAGHDDRAGRGDEGLVDVVLVERHVGAIVAIEDQRERLLVAHAENHQGGQPLRDRSRCRAVATPSRSICSRMKRPIGSSPTRVMSPDFRPEPRRADGDVGGAAADRLGEGRHVLQPAADLLAVEIDRGAADGDDVEAPASWLFLPRPAFGSRVEPLIAALAAIERLFY